MTQASAFAPALHALTHPFATVVTDRSLLSLQGILIGEACGLHPVLVIIQSCTKLLTCAACAKPSTSCVPTAQKPVACAKIPAYRVAKALRRAFRECGDGAHEAGVDALMMTRARGKRTTPGRASGFSETMQLVCVQCEAKSISLMPLNSRL